MQSYHVAIPGRPFCWWHRLADGGGELNTGFTHALGLVRRVSGGTVLRAGGVPVHAQDRAPIVGTFHDTRDAFGTNVDLSQPGLEFGEVDAESGFLVTLDLELDDESKFPGMRYVIFPGNVGSPESVAEAVRIFREA